MEKCDVPRLKLALLNSALGLKIDKMSLDGALIIMTKMRGQKLDLESIRDIVSSGSSDRKRSREDEEEEESR